MLDSISQSYKAKFTRKNIFFFHIKIIKKKKYFVRVARGANAVQNGRRQQRLVVNSGGVQGHGGRSRQ